MLQIARVLLMRQSFNVIYPRGITAAVMSPNNSSVEYRLNIELNQISRSIFVANQSVQVEERGVKRFWS